MGSNEKRTAVDEITNISAQQAMQLFVTVYITIP